MRRVSQSASSLPPLIITLPPLRRQAPPVEHSRFNTSNGSSCTQGDRVAGLSFCTPSCAEGYGPSESFLNCSCGDLTPATFSCDPLPCDTPLATPFIDGQLPCEEGEATIPSNTSCTVRCAEGYTPSVRTLSCSLGVMDASNLTCEEDPCAIPSVTNAAVSGSVCAEPTSPQCEKGYTTLDAECLPSGATCTVQCAPGYTANGSIPIISPVANCSRGILSPFTCDPSPCPAVTNVTDGYCAQGDWVESHTSCSARCLNGSTPNTPYLACAYGVLSIDDFVCVADACLPPRDIPNAAAQACGGANADAQVRYGDTVYLRAHTGHYLRVIERPGSALGSLVLAQGTEKSGAHAFTIEYSNDWNAEVTTEHTASVFFRDTTTGRFLDVAGNAALGWDPGSSLQARSGERLSEGAFTVQTAAGGLLMSDSTVYLQAWTGKNLETDPVTSRLRAQWTDNTGSWQGFTLEKERNTVEHGGECRPACLPYFTPSVPLLQCYRGSLTPSGFDCVPDTCPASHLDVIPYISAGSACAEGGTIEANAACTPQCEAGFVPTQPSLSCYANAFTPPRLFCQPDTISNISALEMGTDYLQFQWTHNTSVRPPALGCNFTRWKVEISSAANEAWSEVASCPGLDEQDTTCNATGLPSGTFHWVRVQQVCEESFVASLAVWDIDYDRLLSDPALLSRFKARAQLR